MVMQSEKDCEAFVMNTGIPIDAAKYYAESSANDCIITNLFLQKTEQQFLNP